MTYKTLLSVAILLATAVSTAAQPVTQPFTFNIVPHTLPHVLQGTQTWGDFDGDGDLDVLVSGRTNVGMQSGIFQNDGADSDGTMQFTQLQSSIDQVVYSSSAWGDADSDGDLDVILLGSTTVDFPYAPRTRLYINDGNGSFTSAGNAGLPDLHSGSISWADVDADGDQDVLITGVDADETNVTRIGTNQGDGTFETSSSGLVGVGYGDGRFGDYDADGDPDILLTGASAGGFVTKIYENDSGQFTDIGASLIPVVFSSADWGDYDSDGDLDVLISGGQISPFIFDSKLTVYENNQGSFNPVDAELDGILAGDVSWGDYDNDGDLDVLVLGAEQALGRRTAHFYENRPGDGFYSRGFLVGSIFSDANWGDFDGDGDLDLISSGLTAFGPPVTNVYRNERQVIPPSPAGPPLQEATVDGASVALQWNAPDQPDMSNRVVTYNVRVGTSPGASDVVSPMADSETGRRLLAGPGNVFGNTSMTLQNLPNGTYYWSVQAINNAFVSSEFSKEGTFIISNGIATDTEDDPVLPTRFDVYANYPNPFSDRTTLTFDLPTPSPVNIRIYNVLGHLITTLTSREYAAGTHHVVWDGTTGTGTSASGGVYFYELRAGSRISSGTMTLVR